MKQKRVFGIILAFLAIGLATLPFIVTFNEALTHAVERIGIYMWVQEKVVPLEVSIVSFIISLFGVSSVAYKNGFAVGDSFLELTWNCLGWQSLLLLGVTLMAGLTNKKYTWVTKIETVLIGLLGTFLVNLFRLVVIILIFAYLRPIYFYVYHNYLAAGVTVIWLFFFWWFSYKFVLVEKRDER
jgi:exosortase/archaeosortase family protein